MFCDEESTQYFLKEDLPETPRVDALVDLLGALALEHLQDPWA